MTIHSSPEDVYKAKKFQGLKNIFQAFELDVDLILIPKFFTFVFMRNSITPEK